MPQKQAGERGALVCKMEEVCACIPERACIQAGVFVHAHACLLGFEEGSTPLGPTDNSPAWSAKDRHGRPGLASSPTQKYCFSQLFFTSQDLNFPFRKKEVLSIA